jgi:hypothetical protein
MAIFAAVCTFIKTMGKKKIFLLTPNKDNVILISVARQNSVSAADIFYIVPLKK